MYLIKLWVQGKQRKGEAMKVLLINGSPHAKGCTYTALNEAEKELNRAGIDTEIIHIGHKDIRGCIAFV